MYPLRQPHHQQAEHCQARQHFDQCEAGGVRSHGGFGISGGATPKRFRYAYDRIRWTTSYGSSFEIVWRSTSTDVWVNFKVFGVMPLTLVFGALQFPLLKKYAAEPAE